MNDGDWICSDPNCGNINFARRSSCYRCNKERPEAAKPFKKKLGTEIGKSAAEKSRGLFNADDWQCNKCANVNWARRPTCNVCNAPKFGEVEARTGYGGGYNERGVVEYRRRESSSDDEYDEFGRKKRKRKADSDDKVGITEGPVNKILPPRMLQKGKMDPVKPVPAPTGSFQANKQTEKVSGSLSDGSVCEFPPLNRVAFKRYNNYNNNSYYYNVNKTIPQNHMNPYRSNGFQRKRFISMGDKDPTVSSGYETSSKKGKSESVSPALQSYNPVMENRVSSTNNDVVYKFSGSTPAEDFEVIYSVRERVTAAAYAIVYNNCKLSTQRFESLFDKPAPDFKTIFAWRQKLIYTGCLVDAHLETQKKDVEKPVAAVFQQQQAKYENKPNVCKKQPNPEEIPIPSDSEDDSPKPPNIDKHPSFIGRHKSVSMESLHGTEMENIPRATGGSVSTLDDRGSQVGSQSASTHHRNRSSSRDSEDSNYPESDLEKTDSKAVVKKSPSIKSNNTRQSVQDSSDSESVSYNSEEVDFRSRVFGDRKTRRKVKKRPIPITPVNKYLPSESQSYQGYSTVKPVEQSPLTTGNIYTMNLHNMGVKPKHHENVHDTDGCSIEYVPTRLAATAKKNYQDFKDNVKKKGFWAKANGNTFSNNKRRMPQITKSVSIQKPITNNYLSEPKAYVPTQRPPVSTQIEDFTRDVVETSVVVDQYLPFEKPLEQVPICDVSKPPPVLDLNSSSFFELVQSSSAVKNKSIMDIFNSNEQRAGSPEQSNDLEKYDNVRKIYETKWDEDDDALYEVSDSVDLHPSNTLNRRTPSPGGGSLRIQSPVTSMLYATSDESPAKSTSSVPVDFMKDALLGLLKDLQDGDDNKISNNVPSFTSKCINTQPRESNESVYQDYQQQQTKETNIISPPIPMQHIPMDIEEQIRIMTNEEELPSVNKPKTISPSKKVHILESITVKPPDYPNNSCVINNLDEELSVHKLPVVIEQPKQNVSQQSVVQSEIIPPVIQNPPQLDFSNLLSGINTEALMLALQNLQQISQKPIDNSNNEQISKCSDEDNQECVTEPVETINLTNDEEWERESNQDERIERELEKLDGNTGDTPFLSDIFDPGPVIVPANLSKKLNLNITSLEENSKTQNPHLNENAPVIGNFKSFALPKPIMLNRLKLAVKQPEKSNRTCNGKAKRSKKSKASGSQGAEGGPEEDEEESGDEADLSKYDLWGSDGEQGNSSKTENEENSKEVEKAEDDRQSLSDKNGKSESQSRKRTRSSSSSSSSSSTSSSSHSSGPDTPKNRFDDFNLNSEREGSPKKSKSRSRSRSPRARSVGAPQRRKSRDSRSGGESRCSRDKEKSRERERRDRSRGSRERKERRYSRDGNNHYSARGRHR